MKLKFTTINCLTLDNLAVLLVCVLQDQSRNTLLKDCSQTQLRLAHHSSTSNSLCLCPLWKPGLVYRSLWRLSTAQRGFQSTASDVQFQSCFRFLIELERWLQVESWRCWAAMNSSLCDGVGLDWQRTILSSSLTVIFSLNTKWIIKKSLRCSMWLEWASQAYFRWISSCRCTLNTISL